MSDLYNYTVKRLARCGIKDPTSMIVFLSEEIEQYREKIKALEKRIYADDPHTESWVEWWPGITLIMTGEEMLYMCPACGAKYADVEGYKYCPNCGTKMDGGAEQ